jgi:DHA1 family tetracycline resistance protein-like MFS transporter
MTDSSPDLPSPEAASETEDTASRGSLAVIFLTVFIDLLGFGLVLPLLPIYADQFTLDPSGLQLGLLMASFSVMQMVFAPFWGSLSDRVGRRPVLMIGLASSAIFYALFGIAAIYKSLPLLFITRIGAGIAGATIPTAQAYIADTTTLKTRARGMALIGLAFGMGFTFGPLLGLIAVLFGNEDPGPWPGFTASALSVAALVLAFFQLPESLHAQSKTAVRKIFDWRGLKNASHGWSVPLLLIAIFVCVFSFANFETTLSLLIKGTEHVGEVPFQFSFQWIFLTYAFIGFTLALVQGGIVRPLSKRVPEVWLATGGAAIEIVGFGCVVWAIQQHSVGLLYLSLTIIVSGFSAMQPSLNSLLSRRADPAQQGVVLGVGQSVNAFARILGSGLGIPMLKASLVVPYWVAAGLMGLGAVLVLVAVKSGSDFEAEPETH